MKNLRAIFGLFSALLMGLALFIGGERPAYAQDDDAIEIAETPAPKKQVRRVETGLRLSRDRYVTTSDIWAPFYQEEDRVLYGDIRVMTDNQSNFEGNLGLGYRRQIGDRIYGGYAYADHRITSLGTDIWQATFGGEYIKADWEVRANLYLPFERTQIYSVGIPGGPFLAGNGIFVRGTSSVIEEAQPGFDAEAGVLLPSFSDIIGDARAYGGVYYFKGDQTPDILGIRGRAQVDLAPWARLGARAQYDAERGPQYFLELTLRFPGIAGTRGAGLAARLADSPERDVDIVTGAIVKAGPPQPVVRLTTGDTAHIIYVDNTSAAKGTGTIETPYRALSDALATATPNDMIYVFAGDGTSNHQDSGATIASNNITIIGAGSPLYFDAEKFGAPDGRDYNFSLLLPAGDFPILTNTGGDAVTIAADDARLDGIHIDNATGAGIRINSGVNGTTLNNLRITGNDGAGIYFDHGGTGPASIRVRETTVTGNRDAGIFIRNLSNGSLNVDLGSSADFGFNDIYGNAGIELYSDLSGHAMDARGNYWGLDAADIGGPDAGLIDQATAATNAFCPECRVTTTTPGLIDDMNAIEGITTESNTLTLGAFTGHRYILVSATNSPDLRINGVSAGGTLAKVQTGDQVSLALTASTTGLSSKSATLSAGDGAYTWTIRTRFLPNALPGLIAWWDAADIDGDFNTADQPANGSLIPSWNDKTGNGHTAVATGSAQPIFLNDAVISDGIDDTMRVSNSGFLSALGGGATVVMVLKGHPTAPNISAFSYSTCTVGVASRCFAVNEAGASGDAIIRLDTSGGNNQNTGATPFTLFDDAPHILVASAVGGNLNAWLDDTSVISAAYSIGTGIGSNAGLLNVGPINGAYYETLLINGALDNTDRTLVTDYLKDKWNLND